MNYKIEKDKYLGKYIVWEVHRNYSEHVFTPKSKKLREQKKECNEWVKKHI